ncbi:baseplate J/gp47 family protein [Brucella anthropi]|uniref:baseplate J/gp47 family protein n=1 Tax=Brucella anthropi TaxID=529 RepID=UPI002362B416|nr:baseplate J/gp47 family protein [Brucella anthropi]
MSAMDEFNSLPKPQMIETLDSEQIVSDTMEDFIDRSAAYGVDYDVNKTGYDPAVIQHEVCAGRETGLRSRINDGAASNLLAFATGSDLDHVAAFYGVYRLDGETDDALRERTALEIKARSPGGSEYWYEAAARRTDVRIRDAKAYREPFWPIIHVAVLSSENGGIPDQAMLDAVNAEVQSNTVRLLNDTVIVEPAVRQIVSIRANYWLLPSAPSLVGDELATDLRRAWQTEAGIGFSLEPSWIEARLFVQGVKRIEILEPVEPVLATSATAIALDEVHLIYQGREY